MNILKASILTHWGTWKKQKLKAPGILYIQPIPPRPAFSFTPSPSLLTPLLTLTPSYLVNPGPCSWGKLNRNSHLIPKSPILCKARKEETVRGLHHFNNKTKLSPSQQQNTTTTKSSKSKNTWVYACFLHARHCSIDFIYPFFFVVVVF